MRPSLLGASPPNRRLRNGTVEGLRNKINISRVRRIWVTYQLVITSCCDQLQINGGTLSKTKKKTYWPFLSLLCYLTTPRQHDTVTPMPMLVVSRYKVPGCAKNCPLVSEYNMDCLVDEPRYQAVYWALVGLQVILFGFGLQPSVINFLHYYPLLIR